MPIVIEEMTMNKDEMKISVIGPGRVGSAIAIGLNQAGYDVVTIAGSSDAQKRDDLAQRVCAEGVYCPIEASIRANVIFLTVADSAIQSVCEQISEAGGFNENSVVVHCSGALGSHALHAAEKKGAKIISAHPLQTFADPKTASASLPGTYWFLEGLTSAQEIIKPVIESLGGNVVVISADHKPLYHAAAVVTSNCLTALIDVATRLYQAVGMSEEDARQAFAPLAKVSLENALEKGATKALTGPVSRGDISTIQKHLDVLKSQPVLSQEVYKTLGKVTAQIALRDNRINKSVEHEILNLLSAREK